MNLGLILSSAQENICTVRVWLWEGVLADVLYKSGVAAVENEQIPDCRKVVDYLNGKGAT
jgi:hypothetical protein